MIITESHINGVHEIVLNPVKDERGFFMRTYDVPLFEENGLHRSWVQENHSMSKKKHVIRGLHFQFPPHSETKLVRVIRGAVFDVYVDLRKDSPTFGQWGGAELTESNNLMLYLPRGFAHGFCTLTDRSEVLYKVDHSYCPEAEGGIIWNDPEIGIDWPATAPTLSQRDARLRSFETFCMEHAGL
jgi:dTDP-4-dehydrorhamnose 3,5-epimerase